MITVVESIMDANITDVEIAIINITSVEDISDAMTC